MNKDFKYIAQLCNKKGLVFLTTDASISTNVGMMNAHDITHIIEINKFSKPGLVRKVSIGKMEFNVVRAVNFKDAAVLFCKEV